MQRVGWYYVIEVEVMLSFDDLKKLWDASGRHYDYKCKGASKPGGILYGWVNRFLGQSDEVLANEEKFRAILDGTSTEAPPACEPVEYFVKTRDLDLCCKILEDPPGMLFSKLGLEMKRILIDANDEWMRMNRPEKWEKENAERGN